MSVKTGRITGKQLHRLYQLAGYSYDALVAWAGDLAGCLPGHLTIDQANELIFQLEHGERTNEHRNANADALRSR